MVRGGRGKPNVDTSTDGSVRDRFSNVARMHAGPLGTRFGIYLTSRCSPSHPSIGIDISTVDQQPLRSCGVEMGGDERHFQFYSLSDGNCRGGCCRFRHRILSQAVYEGVVRRRREILSLEVERPIPTPNTRVAGLEVKPD